MAASEREDFERAKDMRDALRWLERLEEPVSVEVIGTGDADVDRLRARRRRRGRRARSACAEGRVVGREHRFLEGLEEEEDGGRAERVPGRATTCRPRSRARRVVIPFPPDDWDALRELLPDADWTVPQRGTAHRWLELADTNARHLLESLRIESFETEERAEDPVYALGRDLGLSVGAAEPRLRGHLAQPGQGHGRLAGLVRGRPAEEERVPQVQDQGPGPAGRLRGDPRGHHPLPHAPARRGAAAAGPRSSSTAARDSSTPRSTRWTSSASARFRW